MNLKDKRILVTGAASGIGLGAAAFFTQWGAKVFITDIAERALEEARVATGAQGMRTCDVTVEADCDAAVDKAVQTLGGIDGLFHCAGVADRVVKALEIEIDVWQRVLDIHLRGTFLMCRSAGRQMLARQCGSIVNISSITGINGVPRRNAYGPAKAAIAQLTKTLACEWGGSGVRVNALAPGYIATPMIEALAREKKIDVARLEGRTPMGRLGTPEEVAAVAAFLLSDAASYVTGAVVPVDGGWSGFGGSGEVATA